MRVLIQRVCRGSCTVDGRVTGAIELGLVALVGATHTDRAADADWLARKVAGLRVFADERGHMNRDVREVDGAVLVIPQFTLYGSARRGRRPDFMAAARPEIAEPLIERFGVALGAEGVRVAHGVFRAHMAIELVNDGPVTLLLASPSETEGASVAAAAEGA